MLKVSAPTKQQVVHGIERALLVFVTVTGGYWLKTPNPFTKDALVGAAFAGATAVYQLVLSTLTSL